MARLNKRYDHLSLILMLCFAGCIEPYEPNVVKDSPAYLVVDAFLNLDGSASVTLSRTVTLASEEDPSSETGAVVTIEDERGMKMSLNENSNGVYAASGLALNENQRYKLLISTTENQQYASDFIPLKKSPEIDSVTWAIDRDELNIYVNTHDPTGNSRYYRWNYIDTYQYNTAFGSSVKIISPGEIVYRPVTESFFTCWKTDNLYKILIGTTDRLKEDIVREFKLLSIHESSQKFQVKYSILVQQQVLTEDAYNYWLNLQKTTESLGGLFDPMPSQVIGNIHCLTDPSEQVIGYFSGGSITEKRIFISVRDLPRGFPKFRLNCTLDTIPIDEIRGYGPSTLLIHPIFMGALVGYTTSEPSCIDCRLFKGVTTQPDFWE